MKRDLTEDQIMELPEVKAIVNARLDQLKQISEQFFETIIKNINKLPYGIRWICKQISKIAKENFKNSSEDDILKVISFRHFPKSSFPSGHWLLCLLSFHQSCHCNSRCL